ncbi:killer cell lectin-like receptor subfamily E member 1 isoform X2 [Triplophysa rosa]|uniref:killer cell lectin-like receptor subfamily E member 1 isoform X2 n=1 Tax=Triplophysa rosa TaxID=992332 RepID=UPI002545FE49|nr:killer cell lectin-like receptor subfamily E member 1 isoform X2 [Triplophysa rosa]
MYIKLCNFGKPTDCALLSEAKQQTVADTQRKVRVYRIISLVLFAVCVLLLIVVLVLFVKLIGKQSCQTADPTDTALQECNLMKCKDIYQQSLFHESQCPCRHDCDKGWSKFENSCYFLSKDRLSWHESRKECQRRGGDLASITNERLQGYLTTNGNMYYWIGLNQVGTNQWMWNNNTVLTVRYWGQKLSSGDCALLAANEAPERSWHQSICTLYLQYICQITRT